MRSLFTCRRPTTSRSAITSRPRVEQLEARRLLTSWVGQMGGTDYDSVASRAVMDTAGNTYVGGVFTGTADFDFGANTATLASAGGEDAYVAKYSANGDLLWARRFGGSEGDATSSIRLDPTTGALYATGSFRNAADFTGDALPDQTSAGAADVFVVRLDPVTGTTIWNKRIGSTNDDSGTDIAAANGNVFVVGRFRDTVDFNPGTGVNALTSAGKGKNRLWDGFVLNLTDQGSYVWAGQVGGESTDSIRSVIIEDGNLYIAGDFNGAADLNPSASVTTRTSNGRNDAFFGSYSTSGALNWVQTIGGPGGDGNDWRLSSDTGSLYLTGFISEAADFNPGSGTTILTPVGGNDAMIAKYSKNGGALQWAKSFGSTGNDDGRSEVVVNSVDGSVYWGGVFTGTVDFNPAAPGGELASAGAQDAFFIKLDANGGYLNAWRMGSSSMDGGIKPIGIIGSTIYVTGRFEGTADFPTGGTLTSYGNSDGFLMAFDEAPLAISTPLSDALDTSASKSSINGDDGQVVTEMAPLDSWIEALLAEMSQLSKRKRTATDSVDEIFMTYGNPATGAWAFD